MSTGTPYYGGTDSLPKFEGEVNRKEYIGQVSGTVECCAVCHRRINDQRRRDRSMTD
jgi:hypothetical protein